VLVSFIVASLFHTQSVLYRLSQLGTQIPINARVESILNDLIGLAPSYGLMLLVGLSIAFFVTSLLLRKTGISSVLLYCLSGFVAVLVILLAMQPILNITLLASARGYLGFFFQCSAGALGGLLFGALRGFRKHKPTSAA